MNDIKPELCFVDIETTGLDARSEVPLEIALVLTDRFGRSIDEDQFLVKETNHQYVQCALNADDFVNDMHTKNGLWDDLADAETMTRSEVDLALVQFLKRNGVEPRTLPMAGNSIGSLDRPFVLEHFPRFNTFLHYRNLDITSFMIGMEMHFSSRAAWIKNVLTENGTKENAHRALDDCHASIVEYRMIIENLSPVEIPR